MLIQHIRGCVVLVHSTLDHYSITLLNQSITHSHQYNTDNNQQTTNNDINQQRRKDRKRIQRQA